MGFHTLVYHEVRDNFDWSTQSTSKLISGSGYTDQLPQALFVSTQNFREQMQYLTDNGFYFLSMSEVKDFYFNDYQLPEKSILITVDDAFQSFYYNGYPILKEFNIPATLFVASGWLFEDPSEFDPHHSKVMSKDELFSMKDIFEFANHTAHLHNRPEMLSNGVMTASKEELQADLDQCNILVDHQDTFAYPFGFYNQTALLNLSTSGIDFAFTTKPGLNTKDTPHLELHRLLVPHNYTLGMFIDYVESTK